MKNKHGSKNKIFFLQAEDGIRDRNVTGVQTCALPIYHVQEELVVTVTQETKKLRQKRLTVQCRSKRRAQRFDKQRRSEERRVGKECRWRWGRCYLSRYDVSVIHQRNGNRSH